MPNRAITTLFKKSSLNTSGTNLLRKVVELFLDIKSQQIFSYINPYILGHTILDIGTGVGGLAAYLARKGFGVTSIDIVDSSLFSEFPTQLYDGVNMPYADNQFNTALLIHVLHHCEDRMAVLREAMRVSQRVIFIEDTYRNSVEKFVVSFNDNLGNNEYYDHLYSTSSEWESIIKSNNWKIVYTKEFSALTYNILYGRYVLFVIEKETV